MVVPTPPLSPCDICGDDWGVGLDTHILIGVHYCHSVGQANNFLSNLPIHTCNMQLVGVRIEKCLLDCTDRCQDC